MILVTLVVMSATAAVLMWKSARLLSSEDIISTGNIDWQEQNGGPDLFQKRVLAWFAVMWAVIFAAASGVPQFATFRAQILFNEIAVFLGMSLLIMRVYRLNIREALALRPAKPVVWLAVLIAIPCGSIAANAVFRLLNVFIPVSQRMIEQFSRDVLPPGMPQWQIYLYAALIPAVCEEIAFRGILLHGLRKRFRPLFLPVAAGLIFGMFHFSLFRIAPTAFLGMVITAIALMTGSILPGMLLHFGNNAFGIWSEKSGLSLDAIQWWQYIGPVAIFVLALYIIYRNRTPYPDTAQRF
jgi:sodium transport system permease protein